MGRERGGGGGRDVRLGGGHGDLRGEGGGGRRQQGHDRAGHLTTLCI